MPDGALAVEMCPVDCFYEGPNFLVIHPDECIDCALCEPECPVDAIFSEDELPEDEQVYLELNAEWFACSGNAKTICRCIYQGK